MATTAQDVVLAALRKIDVVGAVSELSAEDADQVLLNLGWLWDLWNAKRAAIFALEFPVFTLVPALQPHTIGPTGTFSIDPITGVAYVTRPATIDGASIIIGSGSSATDSPINIRDAQWWQTNLSKSIATDLPTDLYYQPNLTSGNPNGAMYLWAIPTVNYQIRLMLRQLLIGLNVTLLTHVVMPAGYLMATILSLAELIAPDFGQPIPPTLMKMASDARAVIFGVNDVPPRIATRDFGMPRSGRRSTFNWRTGLNVPPG